MDSLWGKRCKEEARKTGGALNGTGLNGTITVFLSLILTCICALLCGLFESARLAGSGWYLQMSLNSAVDSVMSCYHREAWERYRLFLLEYDTEQQLASEVESYLLPYLEEAPYYPLNDRSLSVSVSGRITDQNGKYLEQEIVDYMKYGVWGLEQETETLPELLEGLCEAEGFETIAERYQENGRKVLKLEKMLDQLGDSFRKQKEEVREGRQALARCSGSGFFASAKKLEKELKKVPKLVESYEAEADRLRAQLDVSEAEAGTLRQDLKAGTWSLASEEMDQYRSYVEEEGSRRREVRETVPEAERNLAVLERAMDKAEEVQEYIDSWESDSGEDSEDELDEEALWQQVTEILDAFQEDSRFERSGIQDKKKMNVLESVSRLAGTDLLTLCVPEGTRISSAWLDTADLPSGTGNGEERVRFTGSGTRLVSELRNRALMAEYASYYFPQFLTSSPSGELVYEQEYLLFGEASDRENLKKTVNRLIGVREAVNLLTILGDAGLRGEAEALAAALTGAGAISPLTGVVTFFVMTVWAFAESVEEVRSLLAGERIPFVKQAEQWRVSLTGLAEGGIRGPELIGEEKEASGYSYQDWLKLFFLLQDQAELRYRMMDLVQKNLRRAEPEFRMKHCAFRLEAEVYGEGPLVPIRRTAVQEY